MEIIHQVIANLVRMYDLKNNYLDEDDPWSGILEDGGFAVQRTYHTMLQATTGQMVFRHDMILNSSFIADWEAIRTRKKKNSK